MKEEIANWGENENETMNENVFFFFLYLKTCFGSFESVGVVDGLALRSSGCSVFRSTGLGDGFAPGLSADVDSVVVVAFECICCINGL